jgi:uncharacterized RDD family membrane protein YckC
MSQTVPTRRGPQWSPAMKRHQQRVWPTLVIYAAVLSATLWLFQNHPPTGALKYLAALAPALPLIVVVWLFGRYVYEETDEFRRWQAILSLLIALGIVLAVCIVWGFLEALAGLPHVPLYHVATLFVICQTIGSIIVGLRYR